jgi:hypothetical protein
MVARSIVQNRSDATANQLLSKETTAFLAMNSTLGYKTRAEYIAYKKQEAIKMLPWTIGSSIIGLGSFVYFVSTGQYSMIGMYMLLWTMWIFGKFMIYGPFA